MVPGPNPSYTIPRFWEEEGVSADSAAREKGTKRFVLTSSFLAVLEPSPSEKIIVTQDTWNEKAVEHAWSTLYPGQEHGGLCCKQRHWGESNVGMGH